MNITAIICEYNPFHRGHILQLEEIRHAKGQASAIIALMSGSTVQRGQLSIYSKYARAEAAIKCGVNLVLELPCPYSCGSAEYFARGAISLLDSFCVIDSLCFGSESGDIVMLSNAAENIRKEGYISAVKTPIPPNRIKDVQKPYTEPCSAVNILPLPMIFSLWNIWRH